MLMIKNSFYLILFLAVLFSSMAQAEDRVTRKMEEPVTAWLFDGDWDLFCQNMGHLVGIVDLVEHIKGKDRVVAWAICSRTSNDDNIRIGIDISKKELQFVKDTDFIKGEHIVYSSSPGGTNLHEARLAQYPRPFSTYEYTCPEGSLITGIETFGKKRKVFGNFPVVVRKGIRFLCSKFENGDLVGTSKITVTDRDASWGGSNFGKLECPAGQAAMGIGQIWEGNAINSRRAMTLHCLSVPK